MNDEVLVILDNADVCPPGLTCAGCGEPFRGTVSRRTDDGYVHLVCPPATLRQCGVEGCVKNQHAYGYCHSHGASYLKYGDPLAAERSRAHIDDIEFIVHTGCTWEGTAQRLGMKPESVRDRLRRVGRRDLIDALDRRADGMAS